MKVINVALHVKPELTTQYEAFIHELVVNSSQEPGNGFYGHFKQLGHDMTTRLLSTGKTKPPWISIIKHRTSRTFSLISTSI